MGTLLEQKPKPQASRLVKALMTSAVVLGAVVCFTAVRMSAAPAVELGSGIAARTFSMAGVRPMVAPRSMMSRISQQKPQVQFKNREVSVNAEKKMSIGDLSKAELEGKVALVRCDLNVPLDGKTITDDTRIRASVPTIKHLVENGAKVLLTSHLGRPKDGPEDKFSLSPVAGRMTELLGKDVAMAPDCIG